MIPTDVDITYQFPPVDPSPSLESARRALRDSRTLRPDRRFLLAAAEIKRLAGDRPPFRILAVRESDGWRLESDGSRIGTFSTLPEFEEARRLLRAWAAARLSSVVGAGGPRPEEIRGLEIGASDAFSHGPSLALEKLDRLWQSGARHPSLFRVASVASRSILAQSFDLLWMTDRLDAKALAFLAADEAVTRSDQGETAAFLARWTGYPAEADRLAERLPLSSPIRMWVEDRDGDLRRHSESSTSTPFTRYLFLLRLAQKEDLKGWSAWLEAHPELVVEGLPLIRTALNASDFGPDRENAELMLYVLEIEMGGSTPSPSVWKEMRRSLLESRTTRSIMEILSLFTPERPDPEGVVGRFEGMLSRKVPPGGVFWDPEMARAHYRAVFYSSLFTLGRYELDRRASAAGAEAFAERLKNAPPGPGDAFAQWFSDLVRFEQDQSQVDMLMQDFGTAELVGRQAVRRLADELLRVVPHNDARGRAVVAEWSQRLDSRPYERTLHGSTCYSRLSDLPCYETYYGTGVAALGRDHGVGVISWAGYRNDRDALWRYANSAPKARDRWAALQVLATKKLATEADLIDQSAKIFALDPEDASTHASIAAFLRERGRYRESEALLREQIAEHPEEDSLSSAFYAARLSAALRGQGRAQEAWEVIEPWIPTWKGDAIMEGAAVLDALGRREESLDLARRGLERYPNGPFARADLARILWRQGRYTEVPALYQDPKHPPSPHDWQNNIAASFREVFEKSPREEIERAFEPMLAARFNSWYLMIFAESFAEIERYDVALALLLKITAVQPHVGRLDPKLNVYEYLVRSKGEEHAGSWVRENIPTSSRDALMQTALDRQVFPLFWQAVSMGSEQSDDEDVWLMRAAAVLLDPNRPEEQATAVRTHFQTSRDPQVRFGRLLLGMESPDEAEALGREPANRVRAAYSLGLQALARGADMEAAEWFLLCRELPRIPSADKATLRQEAAARQRANNFLDRWVRDGRARSEGSLPRASRRNVGGSKAPPSGSSRRPGP